MTSQPETLTQLVADALADGLTYRAFREKAVDPDSDYQPSMDTLHKVSKGKSIRLTPELVRAIAAGLQIAPTRAQRAAAVQYAGYSPTSIGERAAVIRDDDAPDSGLQSERAVVEGWDKEVEELRNHPSG